MPDPTQGQIATFGHVGVRQTAEGSVIGKAPTINYVHTTEQEQPDGSIVNGPSTPSIDLNPTVIGLADLLTILLENGDAGKTTDFLGHVRVLPPDPNIRYSLNDAGEVVTGVKD